MILIGDCGSSKTPEIRKILYEYVDCKVVPLLNIDIELTKGYDGIVLSGAPILLTEEKTDQCETPGNWWDRFTGLVNCLGQIGRMAALPMQARSQKNSARPSPTRPP